MSLPADVEKATAPMFEALPLDEAMSELVVRRGPDPEHRLLVDAAIAALDRGGPDPLAAGLWLYIDALDESHRVSQSLDTPTGSFWHAIMHRREGDFSNSHYWLHRTGAHPAMEAIDGYDPGAFVDAVDERAASSLAGLVTLQRAEWSTLFEWCANQR